MLQLLHTLIVTVWTIRTNVIQTTCTCCMPWKRELCGTHACRWPDYTMIIVGLHSLFITLMVRAQLMDASGLLADVSNLCMP